jgi:hypothetical protein
LLQPVWLFDFHSRSPLQLSCPSAYLTQFGRKPLNGEPHL